MATNQFFGRLMNLFIGTQGLPKATPYKEMGVSGTAIFSGLPQVRERNAALVGSQKWITYSDLMTNISIVAAGTRYFLNVVANSTWSLEPADVAGGEEVADFIEDAINDMATPFRRVVRRSSMYRFQGFGVQEWTAKRRTKDKKIGLEDIEARPQHTIERWQVDEHGTVIGVWQRAPAGGDLLYLPRPKIVYMVEDSLTDAPDGLGLFRHLIEPYQRLQRYLELEGRGFERDLRGIPIGRVPYAALAAAVKAGQVTKEDAAKFTRGVEDFVQTEAKSTNTSIVLDSAPYINRGEAGDNFTATMQYGIELLKGESEAFADIGAAIDRCNREMARVLGVEQLLLGEGGGANRALSEDKSRNFYLVVNGSLDEITDAFDKDVVNSICDLNGIKEELRPKLKHSDIALRSVQEITAALASMATAGAVMSPNDPAVNDVRDMLGIAQAPEMTPEQLGMLRGTPMGADEEEDEDGATTEDGEPTDEEAEDNINAGNPKGTKKPKPKKFGRGRLPGRDDIVDVKKFNPHHHPAGSPGGIGGQFAPADRSAFSEADRLRFKELKDVWATINSRLFEHIDDPDSLEVQALMDKLKEVVKEMHGLRADPGGREGVGFPGGDRDVVIIGAGPGGLSAAIMGGTEGLDTLLIEANPDPGGQSRYSSRIENFPGFPVGVTGEELAKSMFEQAERLGVETQLGVRVVDISANPVTDLKTLTLSNGETITTRAVIIAGGLEFNKLPGVEGENVVYGDGKTLASYTGSGTALVIGGSNGAAQAALGVARSANHVYMLSRSEITDNMSDYQVNAVRNNSRITVLEGDQLSSLIRESNRISVTTRGGRRLDVNSVGVFAGSKPNTNWLPASLNRKLGKIITDSNLQTSMRGVYAVGDVRDGGIGRIGGAVGDGQMAIKNLSSYLYPTMSKAKRVSGWNRLVDALFALDREYPFFGQTADDEQVVKFNPYHDEIGRFTSAPGRGGDDIESLYSPVATDLEEAKAWLKSVEVREAVGKVVKSPLTKAAVTAALSGLVGDVMQYNDPISDELIEQHVQALSNHMMVATGIASVTLREATKALKEIYHNPKIGTYTPAIKKARKNDALSRALDAVLAALDRYDTLQKFNPNHDELGRFAEAPGGAAADKATTEMIVNDMSQAPKVQPVRQSIKDLDELYERSKAGEADFQRQVQALVDETGGRMMLPPPELSEPGTRLKSRESAERKLTSELDGQVDRLLDVLRATAAYQTVEESRLGLAAFLTKNRANIVRVKDRQEHPTGGYRDMLVNFRTKSGVIAELQFQTNHMWEAKQGEGHRLYEQARKVAATFGKPGESKSAKRIVSFLNHKSEVLYNKAFEDDGNHDYKQKIKIRRTA